MGTTNAFLNCTGHTPVAKQKLDGVLQRLAYFAAYFFRIFGASPSGPALLSFLKALMILAISTDVTGAKIILVLKGSGFDTCS